MGYHIGQLCLNGHIITGNIKDEHSEKYCSKCGAGTISSCQNCNENIKGDYNWEFGYESMDTIPYFCINCGKPYPWTEKVLNNAVEIVALDENLSKEQKELINTTFPDLLVETPTTPVAIAKYKKIIENAQQYVKDGLKQLLIKVATEAVKKSIWG